MLNPLLLWFLPLAALPVILHLLNLNRLREVELPGLKGKASKTPPKGKG